MVNVYDRRDRLFFHIQGEWNLKVYGQTADPRCPHLGDWQNYGPFLGPYYNTGPNLGDPKRDHNFDNPPPRKAF